MRVSEFWQAVTDEFGDAYGRSVTRDLVLREVGDLTAVEAIAAGKDTRDIWFAVCAATDVPRHRWHGAGQLPKK
ncbi:MAG: DUF3046 domain-containing protein [Burkholderiaceae bacterium]|nr:DUF3046 domain-containing protein [Microbacteriaceae bacterium]